MGFRNALKYKRRSLQICFIVAVGAFVITSIGSFTISFKEKFLKDMLENTAHGKIYYTGYYQKQEISPLELSMNNYETITAKMFAKDNTMLISPSISAGVVVSKKDESANMFCMGIKPFTDKNGKNVFNTYKIYKNTLLAGRFFKNNNDSGIMISSYTAGVLKCTLNDRIILFTSDSYGSFNAVELPVIGIFKTGYVDKDENICLADIKSVQQLVGLENRATEISLFFNDILKADTFKTDYAEILKTHNLEFYSWKDLLGPMISLIDFGMLFNTLVYFIFMLVATVGIMNTVLISIFDRIRDIGTLRSIGFTRMDVNSMIMAEVFILGLFGAVLGTAVGGSLIYWLSVVGIPISNESKEFAGSFFNSNRIYPVFGFKYLIDPLVVSAIVPVLSAIYPLRVLRKKKIKELLGYI